MFCWTKVGSLMLGDGYLMVQYKQKVWMFHCTKMVKLVKDEEIKSLRG